VSGAGKSTIVSLILRLYEPHEGAVLIDGVDIRRYRRESLRRQIGLVLQESICSGRPSGEHRLRQAGGRPRGHRGRRAGGQCRRVHSRSGRRIRHGDRRARRQPVGGQRQRIAIARALIRAAPILILDEPMTGLDVESEDKVRQALNRLMTGKTCVMITHDLQSIADADQVLVLEEGRIIAAERTPSWWARAAVSPVVRARSAANACSPSELANGVPNRELATAAVSPETSPADPDFPQLEVARDPARMLGVFEPI